MSEYFLQYLSEPVVCGFPKSEPFGTNIDGWHIRDDTTETNRIEKDTSLVEYQVIVEKKVDRKQDKEEQRKELRDFQDEAFDLINELKLVWPLVFGDIQSPSETTHRPQNAPDHWSSNSRDLLEDLHPSRFTMKLSIDDQQWVILPYHPLRRLLAARSAYREASNPIRTLVKLYYDALDSNPHAAMFMFAKALELVRAILPGDTDRERTQALAHEVRKAIDKDLSWLFMIANNRLDVRHVVRDPYDLALHPEMTEDERTDFSKNASKVIKSVIEGNLGLSIAIPEGQRTAIAEFRSL